VVFAITVIVALFASSLLHISRLPECENPVQTERAGGSGYVTADPDGCDIWGAAAIATFLWESIFAGSLSPSPDGTTMIGEASVHDRQVTFRTGPGLHTSFLAAKLSRNQIFVLNGRSPEKISESTAWVEQMEELPESHLNVVVWLGTEACENTWILSKLRKNGGFVDSLFIVYDDGEVDGETIYQWPLGTATYVYSVLLISYKRSCSVFPLVEILFNFVKSFITGTADSLRLAAQILISIKPVLIRSTSSELFTKT
jgi:hypothetical protein